MKRHPLILLILSVFAFHALDGQNVERFDAMNKNRDAVKRAYRQVYLPARDFDNNWIHGKECDPGHLSAASLNARLTEINYFRSLCGLAPVTFNPENNRLAQAAANLMRVNGELDHHPPQTWKCYSEEAAKGAGSCNLGLGGDLRTFMQDLGSSNRDCGHRMWILDSDKAEMGYGGAGSASAVYVFGLKSNPTRLPQYITWPAAGFFPAELAPERWTFSVPGIRAKYENAKVEVTVDGQAVPLVYYQYTPYADGGLAFEIADYDVFWETNLDKRIKVQISGVEIGKEIHSYGYELVLFEAEKDDQVQLVVSGLKSNETKMVADAGNGSNSQEAYAVEVGEDESDELEPEMEIALPDRTLVDFAQLHAEEGLEELLVQKLATAFKLKMKYSEAYASIANRISDIRKEKDPDPAKMKDYAGRKVTEIVTGKAISGGAESASSTQSKFYLYEFKKLVPGGGSVTFDKLAEVLVQECAQNAEMKSFLLKYPGLRNVAWGFAGKPVTRQGKTCFGLYVTVLVAPPAKV